MMQSEGDQRRKSHSAFQSLGGFLCVSFCVYCQGGGGIKSELSHVSSKLRDLS